MDGSAALISVPLWVYVGYFFANDLDLVIKWVRHSEVFILIAIVVMIPSIFIYKKIKQKNKK
jgi:membrane protein DedA with SNARE-associated domain